MIVGKSHSYFLWIDSDNLRWELHDNITGTWIDAQGEGGLSLPAPNDDEWHYIVSTYDGRYFRTYIDGELKREFEWGEIDITENSNPVGIGESPGWNRWFNGLIDEVCIYNRALSAEEISDLYNNYGYTTTNYPGKVLVRKYAEPEPTVDVGFEQSREFYISLMTDKANYSTGEVINLAIEVNRTQEYPQVMKFKLELEDLDGKPDVLIETGSFVMPAKFHKKVVLRFVIPESPFVSSGRYAFKAYLIEPSLDEVLAYDAVNFNVEETKAKAVGSILA